MMALYTAELDRLLRDRYALQLQLELAEFWFSYATARQLRRELADVDAAIDNELHRPAVAA